MNKEKDKFEKKQKKAQEWLDQELQELIALRKDLAVIPVHLSLIKLNMCIAGIGAHISEYETGRDDFAEEKAFLNELETLKIKVVPAYIRQYDFEA